MTNTNFKKKLLTNIIIKMNNQDLNQYPNAQELERVGFSKTEEGDFVYTIDSPHGIFIKYKFRPYAHSFLCGNGKESYIGYNKIDINNTLEVLGNKAIDWTPNIENGQIWTNEDYVVVVSQTSISSVRFNILFEHKKSKFSQFACLTHSKEEFTARYTLEEKNIKELITDLPF